MLVSLVFMFGTFEIFNDLQKLKKLRYWMNPNTSSHIQHDCGNWVIITNLSEDFLLGLFIS